MIFKTVENFNTDTKQITQSVSYGIGNWGPAAKAQRDFNDALFNESIQKDTQAIADFNKMVREEGLTASEATSRMTEASDACRTYCMNHADGVDDIEDFTKAQRDQYDASIKSQKGLKGFSSSFKAMALNIGAEMAIMLALTLAIKGFQKLNEEFHITAASKVEAMENAVNDYNEALEQSGDNISTIKGLQDEFETLARGVNDAGENIGLSADEYERYHEIVDELVKMNPELVQGYDNCMIP